MARRRRQRKVPTPTWERDRSAIGRQIFGQSPQVYATLGIVLLMIVALGIVAFAFASDYIEDQRRPGSTAVKVGDSEYSVSYFSNRLKMFTETFGGVRNIDDPQVVVFLLSSVAASIMEESTVIQFASEQEVSATDEEVRAQVAFDLKITPEQENFDSLLEAELLNNGLSEDEFWDKARAAVLRKKLVDKFQAALPAGVESVHYREIAVDSQAEAEEIQKQVEAGADFAQLAIEKSKDEKAKENGGDQGWVPRGVMDDPSKEDAIFALEPGQLTTFPTQSGAFVLQVVEKQADRPIDEENKQTLAQAELDKWLTEKKEQVGVVNNMDPSTGDPEKIRYALEHLLAA